MQTLIEWKIKKIVSKVKYSWDNLISFIARYSNYRLFVQVSKYQYGIRYSNQDLAKKVQWSKIQMAYIFVNAKCVLEVGYAI